MYIDTTWCFQLYGNNYASFYENALSGNNLLTSTILSNYQVWYDNGGNNNGWITFWNSNYTSFYSFFLQRTLQSRF